MRAIRCSHTVPAASPPMMLSWHHCVGQHVSGNVTDIGTTFIKHDTEREGSVPSHMFTVCDKLPPVPAQEGIG